MVIYPILKRNPMAKLLVIALPLIVLPAVLSHWAENMQKEIHQGSEARMERIINSVK